MSEVSMFACSVGTTLVFLRELCNLFQVVKLTILSLQNKFAAVTKSFDAHRNIPSPRKEKVKIFSKGICLSTSVDFLLNGIQYLHLFCSSKY